jgi:hypothetical protein
VHKGEEWSAQRPLDRSREGEMGGRRKQGPATACGHAAIRRGRGGGPARICARAGSWRPKAAGPGEGERRSVKNRGAWWASSTGEELSAWAAVWRSRVDDFGPA